MSRSIIVDGVEIPEFLIAQEMQNHPGVSVAQARVEAGKALAVKALLLSRAAELGLVADPEMDEAGREETPEEALIRAVLEIEVEVPRPSDAECRRVYDANPVRFSSPALYAASHILIEPADASPEAGEIARQTASGACAEIALAPSRFADIARALSTCPSAGVGGALGQLQVGDLAPEVEAGLFRLKDGETSTGPVRSRFGWHVLRMDRMVPGRLLPFEMVAERIRLHLESRAWTAAAARYVNSLAQDAQGQGVIIRLEKDGAYRGGALVLGDFLGDEAAAAKVAPWLEATDPELGARLAVAAEAAGVSANVFVRNAAAAFAQEADDERWTQLISAVRDGEDPALAALGHILRSRLTPAKRAYTVIRRVASL